MSQTEPAAYSVVVTHFPDEFAKTKTERTYSLPELVGEILAADGARKEDLQWLKCARFGDRRSRKNSLRHDDNVLAVYGAEADYDAEGMSFEQAVQKAKAAGILCVIYTSPRHTEDTPRWRIICVFSQEYPPEARVKFLARLNGVYGDIFDPASWTLSQSYYYGAVNHNPSHRAELIDGTPIDLLEALDATAIYKPAKAQTTTRPTAKPVQSSDQLARRYHGFIAKLLDNVRNARDGEKHFTLLNNARSLGGVMDAAGITESDAVAWLLDALPESVKDWNNARQTARDGLRDGRVNPLELEDRQPTNGSADAPSQPSAAPPSPAGGAKKDAKPPNILSLVTHIKMAPVWNGALRFNLFTENYEVCPPFPPQPGAKEPPRPLADPFDILRATMYFQANGFPKANKGVVFDALAVVAHENSYHPVRDYLNSLQWDETGRVGQLFQHYFNAELPADDPTEHDKRVAYLEHTSIGFMVGAVARVMSPGCQADHVPVVVSHDQGMQKSTAIRKLCPDESWFTDNISPDLSRLSRNQ
jgi:Virulence-associated protein E